MLNRIINWLRPTPQFKPCVVYYEESGITEMVLKDCFTVWCPLANSSGHYVDLGYDREGELVAIRVWGDVREREGPTRAIWEGADLLKRLQAVRQSSDK